MKKTIKTDVAVSAYKTAQNLKLKGVERKDVFAYLHNKNVLKATATAYEEFTKDAQEQLKPEGWDAIAEKLRTNEKAKPEARVELTAKESEAVKKYNRELTDCIEAELKKEVEVELEPLSEDGLFALIQANDVVAEAFSIIQEVMCE